MAGRTLMTFHAHPDDESSKSAGTVARYGREGVRTVLLTATGGEEGDILNPAMDTPEVRGRLAEVRREELRRATQIIGYDAVHLLGYRDSGMAGSEANDHPDSFAAAPFEEAVGRVVAHLRRERPDVFLIYADERKLYPHPDHVRVHEVGRQAFLDAADPDRHPEAGEPWQVAKLYEMVFPKRYLLRMDAKFKELGLESPVDPKRWAALEELDDGVITTRIDVGEEWDVRLRALKEHATQIDPDSPFWFGLPPEAVREISTTEDYVLAAQAPGVPPLEPGVEESDLFERID